MIMAVVYFDMQLGAAHLNTDHSKNVIGFQQNLVKKCFCFKKKIPLPVPQVLETAKKYVCDGAHSQYFAVQIKKLCFFKD